MLPMCVASLNLRSLPPHPTLKPSPLYILVEEKVIETT
jgi:hypothetical protein